ncbi:cytochrome c oxidase cbb3-type subunit 3 [Monaibacterium marinum]|uniref:Cbb3-type cytochrome c oxidase subunit n=1 Tax=Pontivivens marinum TaxID=1690039 RepID=A0A2C9CRH0_9RHOB|nr:cytochrome-c oxidase, cbb3-type subunit III [Monaibacterium marinum]SOH93832.1 cytochrome c oxidase cbb3-type subunit 3 [Monaibacterium marinum]
MSENRVDEETGVETTGHSWDGIEELNNPLPRWWLWSFYATIVWGIAYVIAFPAWPLINGATPGLLGYSTRGEVAEEIARVDAANAGLEADLAAADLAALSPDDPLYRFATSGGAAVFRTNCSQCHGSGAAGAVGYPNLLDDDWLWGGTVEDIRTTVQHGIRNDDDRDARWSEMPAFGDILSEEEIDTLVAYVGGGLGIADPGHELFLNNCAACHGDTGTGDRTMGAPDLTDAIWLYGNSEAALTQTITNARFGVMPPWAERLSEADIAAVALYVHQLGGGE